MHSPLNLQVKIVANSIYKAKSAEGLQLQGAFPVTLDLY